MVSLQKATSMSSLYTSQLKLTFPVLSVLSLTCQRPKPISKGVLGSTLESESEGLDPQSPQGLELATEEEVLVQQMSMYFD